MKIKSMIDKDDICNVARYNPNTIGTHLFMHDAEENEKKNEYTNIVLLKLMLKRGFFSGDFNQMVEDATDYVNDYEKNNVMGL